MKKIIFTAIIMAMTMTACNSNQSGSAAGEQTAEAADTLLKPFTKDNFYWVREPKLYEITDSAITIVTEPHTDLWQRTYYGFQNDSAPVLQMKTARKFFSFTVKTDFSDAGVLFDQCGIAVYLDSENWMKSSIEYENSEFQRLGSVVTNNGYSDWATHDIPSTVRQMWYRLSRRNSDFYIETSEDGTDWHQMRSFHLFRGDGEISFGIYAASPTDHSFTARFTNMKMEECQWEAWNADDTGFTETK